MRYTLETAKQIISKTISIDNIAQIGEGNHCQAFLINNKFVVKLPKHKKASDCLYKEIKVLNYLKNKLNVEIPTVEFSKEYIINESIFIFYGSKIISGKKLSKKEFVELDEKTTKKNAEIIALFLFKLHKNKEIFNAKRKDYCLLHGDFSLNHCVFNNNIVTGILDFGDAKIGKFLSDFIYLLDDEDDEEFGVKFGNQVLSIYKKLGEKYDNI